MQIPRESETSSPSKIPSDLHFTCDLDVSFHPAFSFLEWVWEEEEEEEDGRFGLI